MRSYQELEQIFTSNGYTVSSQFGESTFPRVVFVEVAHDESSIGQLRKALDASLDRDALLLVEGRDDNLEAHLQRDDVSDPDEMRRSALEQRDQYFYRRQPYFALLSDYDSRTLIVGVDNLVSSILLHSLKVVLMSPSVRTDDGYVPTEDVLTVYNDENNKRVSWMRDSLLATLERNPTAQLYVLAEGTSLGNTPEILEPIIPNSLHAQGIPYLSLQLALDPSTREYQANRVIN